jgi:hypothetical protein
VQELFPRLFGGGHAYLELTGEDLLDTGVAIIARPPGKRAVEHLAAVGRREGADRGVAGVRDLPSESRRRSACWTKSTRRWTRPTSVASARWCPR